MQANLIGVELLKVLEKNRVISDDELNKRLRCVLISQHLDETKKRIGERELEIIKKIN
ncbi:hypothetical protein GOV12_00505 [Candidatus Pacearchaeota archaeon]|nr:hypothetical protein [Candidatus Pacearchaeota archaeon]